MRERWRLSAPSRGGLLGATLATATLGAVWWWAPASPTHEPVRLVQPGAAAASPLTDAQTWRDGLQSATQALVRRPDVAPVSSALTERPDYVSMWEWVALKTTAAQHADPDRELVRMVNVLRLSKQVDLVEGVTPASLATRQQAARAVLADLPAQVRRGDLAEVDAQQLRARCLALIGARPTP
ncbi:hypothetical protein [Aquabacterium sp.]|uniref:hypothetical protein n=1 Tax=Aquabacterium sp. TaxID=1872578 RepID=UPI003BB16FCD